MGTNHGCAPNLLEAGAIAGQAVIAVTGTAVALGSGKLLNGVIICAKTTNAAVILVGPTGVTNVSNGTGSGYILTAGSAVSAAADNLNKIFINGTAGDIVSYIAS